MDFIAQASTTLDVTSAGIIGGLFTVALGLVRSIEVLASKKSNGRAATEKSNGVILDKIASVELVAYQEATRTILSDIRTATKAIEKSCERSQQVMDQFLREGCPNARRIEDLLNQRGS